MQIWTCKSTVVIIQKITDSYFFNGVKKAHKAKHMKDFWTFDHSVLGSEGMYFYCHVCLLVFSRCIWPNVYYTEEVIWGKDTLIVVLKVWSRTTWEFIRGAHSLPTSTPFNEKFREGGEICVLTSLLGQSLKSMVLEKHCIRQGSCCSAVSNRELK